MADGNDETVALVGHRFRQEDRQFQNWCLSNGSRMRVHVSICNDGQLAGSSPCFIAEHYDGADYEDGEVPPVVASVANLPFELEQVRAGVRKRSQQ